MQQLKKFICLLLFLFIMSSCQEKIAYDKEWAANFAQQQVKAMDGYRLEGVYFYQGNHIRVNDQKVGKAVVVKAVVRYYDVFKDPNKYELVSVFDESNIDLAGQGYIYGEDGDRLLGVDQIDVYDSNQPIKYLRAMDDKDISEVNRKLNTVQIK